MVEDLIKRLRSDQGAGESHWKDCEEAADLIEQQAARITALESERATLLHDVEIHAQEAIYAHAKVEAMEKGVEPVGWVLRIGDSDVWSYVESESDADFYGKKSGLKYEKRPRYAAPPSHPDMGRLDFLIEKEAGVWTNGFEWIVAQCGFDDPDSFGVAKTPREAIDAALANQKQAG